MLFPSLADHSTTTMMMMTIGLGPLEPVLLLGQANKPKRDALALANGLTYNHLRLVIRFWNDSI